MKAKLARAYMTTAQAFAECSTARRLQVGAIIVKDDRIISIGYNGTPSGWDNNCEIEFDNEGLVTKPEVLHAESNAITKLARSTESGLDSTMFCTHAACVECAKLIMQTGIKEFYFKNYYRNDEGLALLKKHGIIVKQFKEEN